MAEHRVKELVISLFSQIQLARIYPAEHPKLKEGLSGALDLLNSILQGRDEVIIGFIGEEIAFEKEIFFDLTERFRAMTAELKDKGIEKIVFEKGVSLEELHGFIVTVSGKNDNAGAVKEELARRGVEHISFDKVTTGPRRRDKGGAEDESGEVDGLIESFSSILRGEQLDMLKFKLTMDRFYQNMARGNRAFVGADLLCKYDLSTFLHSINVSLLAMFFVARLGYSRENILSVGTAALLHDMGKIAISQSIVKKPGGLTDEEFARIKSHTVLGALILLKYRESIGPLPLVVSFEHHLNYDLSGYPRREFPVMPGLISRIVTICDFYDALRSRRAYKKQVSPEGIYEMMQKEKGKKFDPLLLDRFFQEIGVFPVGTVVSLSDGSSAEVKETHKDEIFRPIVEVTGPPERKGTVIDLKRHPEIEIRETIIPVP